MEQKAMNKKIADAAKILEDLKKADQSTKKKVVPKSSIPSPKFPYKKRESSSNDERFGFGQHSKFKISEIPAEKIEEEEDDQDDYDEHDEFNAKNQSEQKFSYDQYQNIRENTQMRSSGPNYLDSRQQQQQDESDHMERQSAHYSKQRRTRQKQQVQSDRDGNEKLQSVLDRMDHMSSSVVAAVGNKRAPGDINAYQIENKKHQIAMFTRIKDKMKIDISKETADEDGDGIDFYDGAKCLVPAFDQNVQLEREIGEIYLDAHDKKHAEQQKQTHKMAHAIVQLSKKESTVEQQTTGLMLCLRMTQSDVIDVHDAYTKMGQDQITSVTQGMKISNTLAKPMMKIFASIIQKSDQDLAEFVIPITADKAPRHAVKLIYHFWDKQFADEDGAMKKWQEFDEFGKLAHIVKSKSCCDHIYSKDIAKVKRLRQPWRLMLLFGQFMFASLGRSGNEHSAQIICKQVITRNIFNILNVALMTVAEGTVSLECKKAEEDGEYGIKTIKVCKEIMFVDEDIPRRGMEEYMESTYQDDHEKWMLDSGLGGDAKDLKFND